MTKSLFTFLLASAFPIVHASAQLYSDNFDTDSSASWSVFDGSGNDVSDFTVQFAFDYSVHGIPSAPNSTGGTTSGVKLTVNNNDDVLATAGVSLYPNGQSFSGDYALKVDMWINYNGPAFGGSGSTEFGIFGLNHVGDKVNWTGTPAEQPGDGVWFAVSGEGGSSIDYRAYVGDPAGGQVNLGDTGGFLDRDNDGAGEVNSNDDPTNPMAFVFPAPPFETPGAPGKQWVAVEVRQQGGTVTWLINGFVIAEHSNLLAFSGNVMLGYMDIFTSIANPREDNFVLYDNLRVEDLTGAASLPVVSVEVVDAEASEPGSDTGLFRVSRTGDLSGSLTVRLRAAGTAAAGSDYTALPSEVTLSAGVGSTDLVVSPLNDSLGEAVETVVLSVLSSNDYEVREGVFGVVDLMDDGDVPMATIEVERPAVYEPNAERPARFQVIFSNPNDTATTVQYTISGSAVNGTDYVMIPGSVSIPAGETTVAINITPIDNADVDGDRAVELTLAAGSGYTLGATLTASVVIRNDDLPSGTTAFAEDFETDSPGAWIVNAAHSNNRAVFAFDYSTVGIPSAPHSSGGTTLGLQLQANTLDGDATFTGVSVSPVDQAFTGDYRLRFDMWINYNGPLNGGGSGSTFLQTAGVGTPGASPQWPGGTHDSVWFAATGDGGSGVDYRAYSVEAATGYTPASGVFAAGTADNARNELNSYYREFGGETAPAAQLAIDPGQTGASFAGAVGMAWRDVVIAKQGNTITFHIDGLRIATVDAAALTLGANIFVGFSDINSGQTGNPAMSFGLVDNLRVEVSAQAADILSIREEAGQIQIEFTGAAGDSASAFALAASDTVAGTYQEIAATITELGPGRFRATTAVAGETRFYLVRR